MNKFLSTTKKITSEKIKRIPKQLSASGAGDKSSKSATKQNQIFYQAYEKITSRRFFMFEDKTLFE